ncbi:MAG: hypothetical protein ACRBCI_04320 [Cellvibrionaceae bacterium]
MGFVKPLNQQELIRMNKMLVDVHIAISASMAYVRKLQRWKFEHLESKFIGVNISTWKRYLQPSYSKIRPLHVVAAYSWLTMLPMSCFYRGLNIREAYPDLDDISVECLIHSGLLPKLEFGYVVDQLFCNLTEKQKVSTKLFEDAIGERYGFLNDYDDKDYMFPDRLDMELFAYDYYYSFAVSLKEFREKNNIPLSIMAEVLSLSLHRYKQCENTDNPIPLPVELGARLQVGFRLDNALPFTAHMKHYKQFHLVRRVQEIRQTLFVEIVKNISPFNRSRLLALISNVSSTIKEIDVNKKKLNDMISSMGAMNRVYANGE